MFFRAPLTVLARSAHTAHLRIKTRLFHTQCIGKSLSFSCKKEPQVLGSLVHVIYEGTQDSEALWYSMCRKEPQVLSSLLRITYEVAAVQADLGKTAYLM